MIKYLAMFVLSVFWLQACASASENPPEPTARVATQPVDECDDCGPYGCSVICWTFCEETFSSRCSTGAVCQDSECKYVSDVSCSTDSDCFGVGHCSVGGKCQPSASCTSSAQCATGYTCQSDSELCHSSCDSSYDCIGTYTCSDHECVPKQCVKDSDCGPLGTNLSTHCEMDGVCHGGAGASAPNPTSCGLFVDFDSSSGLQCYFPCRGSYCQAGTTCNGSSGECELNP
jgi:hypothetical protein